MEHKTLPFALKQPDSLLSGVIEGYAAVMGKLSIGYEAVKAAFEKVEDKYIRRLKEVKLFEWSPVWVAMNPAAVVTGVKGREDEGGAPDPYGLLTASVAQLRADLEGELKEGRRLSSASVTKVDSALGALRDAIDALETLLAAAETDKGHSALSRETDLRIAQSAYDVLIARARAAGLN